MLEFYQAWATYEDLMALTEEMLGEIARRVAGTTKVVFEGAELDFSLGAKSGLKGHFPVVGRFRVERLGDGDFTCKGPFYKGARMSLGPMAALRKDDVTVVVASRKVQAADQEMFRHLLIEPMEKKIVVLKSSVHFRAHFGPIAEKVLVVAAPGPVAANPEMLRWRRLRPGIRLRPFGRPFAPTAS